MSLQYEIHYTDGNVVTIDREPLWLPRFRYLIHGSQYVWESRAKEAQDMTIKIIPNDKGNPPSQLATAELHFTDGPLAGLKLIGFSLWEGSGSQKDRRYVTFPSRSYAVNGERRTFALLRPIIDTAAQTTIRDRILEAYAEYEAAAAVTI